MFYTLGGSCCSIKKLQEDYITGKGEFAMKKSKSKEKKFRLVSSVIKNIVNRFYFLGKNIF